MIVGTKPRNTKLVFGVCLPHIVVTNVFRSRTCGLDGCKYPHHRLLHESKTTTSAHVIDNIKSTEEQKPPDMNNNHNSENPRTHTSLTMASESDGHDLVVLRTVAVNLVSGNKRVRVNALLDDCSTSTYINGDVAAHLGLEGTPDHLDVHVLDGGTSSLNSSIVSFTVESTDGRIRKQISAHTTNRVTGEMQVINWNKHRDKWPHLQNIKFPSCGSRPIVDILIGADHCDLLLSQDEVVGASGEPIARLTPLGWTCIGHIPGMKPSASYTLHLLRE